MYYSIFTVGDVDIDQEHTNIDFMLTSLNSVSPDQLPALLEKLIDAVIQHFVNEEEICSERGYNMIESHKATHHRLTEELLAMKATLHSTSADIKTYPGILQEILKTHILEFDRYLKSPDPFAT